MDTDRFGRISELFETARSLPKDECNQYLIKSCGDDAELREEVEELLAEHTRQSPLDTNAPGELAELIAIEAVETESNTPTKIDRYTIINHIGEGGMGSVYEARQQNPDRAVAIKVIKRGMDTKQVIARFEAERQAVAMMDHPNIAQVFDAGTTEDGRPFFAMELVRGVSIIEYCETQKLDIDSRLNLFVQVCRAIQHAHQRGIIHRDIKPSNVLVTQVDGLPVPKVIDFGIAKATDTEFNEKTAITMHGQLVGTPAYMSPEQTKLGGQHVDTRTDIYSLGVLLYELLTGTTPFTNKDLLSKGFAEMMRVINDDEPDKPSTRLGTLEKQGATTAIGRADGARMLGSMLRGDLDWIAMKCLEKNPDRRYESSSALAQDITRFMQNEPIEARPPSHAYQIQKFVQRHRARVIAGAMVLGVLVLGIAGTTGGMIWALDEQANAKQSAQVAENETQTAEAIVEFLLTDLLGAADPARMEDRDLTVRQAVSIASDSIEGKFANRPEVEARVRLTIARTLEQLGIFDDAEPHHRRQIELYESLQGKAGNNTINAMHSLASNLMHQSRFDDAIEVTIEEIDTLRETREPRDEQLINALSNLGVAYLQTGRYTKAAPILEETLIAKRLTNGDLDPSTLSSIHNLAGLYGQIGEKERSLELAREAYQGRLEALGPGDPRTFGSLNLVTWMLNGLERYDESKEILEDAITNAESRLGPSHVQTTSLIRTLATQHKMLGEFEQAEKMLAPLLVVLTDTLGNDNINTFSTMRSLADTIAEQGRYEESLNLYVQALSSARSALPPTSIDLTQFMDSYGRALTLAHRFTEAEIVLAEATTILENAGPNGERSYTESIQSMINLYRARHENEPKGGYDEKLKRWESKL